MAYKFNGFILNKKFDPQSNGPVHSDWWKLNGSSVIQGVPYVSMVWVDHKVSPTTSLTLWWGMYAHEHFPTYGILNGIQKVNTACLDSDCIMVFSSRLDLRPICQLRITYWKHQLSCIHSIVMQALELRLEWKVPKHNMVPKHMSASTNTMAKTDLKSNFKLLHNCKNKSDPWLWSNLPLTGYWLLM